MQKQTIGCEHNGNQMKSVLLIDRFINSKSQWERDSMPSQAVTGLVWISARERVSTIWKETFDKNRKTLESFREDWNTNFKKMTMEVTLPIQKLKMYEEVINEFNSECFKVLNKKMTKNDKTIKLEIQNRNLQSKD